MDKRFSGLFNLSEDEAIALLDAPPDPQDAGNSRYVAAAHLVNFASERTVQALMRAVQNTDSALDNRIVRRKAVETLGRLKAAEALPLIRTCLADSDCYTVENAVWAIGEIGTQDGELLADVARLLDQADQTHRVIIHTLAKFHYTPALEQIRRYTDHSDPPTASAAIAAVCRLTQDFSEMERVVGFLRHPNVLARRLSIQDLVDARYYPAIPAIASCPVSLVFRLRGLRMLAEAGLTEGAISFDEVRPSLERSLRDHPHSLALVHQYEQPPTLSYLIRELYETDFGRSYLAAKTLLASYPQEAPEALFATYAEEAHMDYGAHFHVMKLFGWLRHAPAFDLLLEALNNPQPQFQKSRAAAAIALGELGDPRAIPALKDSLQTPIWDLKYAALLALEQLGDRCGYEVLATDEDPLLRAKAFIG